MIDSEMLDQPEPAMMEDGILSDDILSQIMMESGRDDGHYQNLLDSDAIDTSKIRGLGLDVITWVRDDESSRATWIEQEKSAMKACGLDREASKPDYEGGTSAVHTALIKAVEQLRSRALVELRPASGNIVKTDIVGLKDENIVMQSNRVADFMNYLYTKGMDNEFNEQDMLLFRIGISGSCFKHVYYCKRTEKFKAVFVKPEDMIVPWNASCMASTERFTHRYFESNATFKRNKTSGYYSGSDIVKPSSEDVNEVRAVELKSQGTTPNAIADVNQHEILKCHCALEIEDGYDYPMEYIVWVEKQSQEVIRVQRNWKPTDETQQRVVRYAHYKCFSGLGFYGLGFYHLMGGSIDALTDMLRLIIDGSMEASFGGGFMSDEAKIDLVRGQVTKGKDGKRPPPRTFRKIRASPEDLSRAFFVPPSKEPTPMLLSAMQYVDGGVSDFSGINGVLSGDSKAVNMPVGTVLALIEQGSTQFSAVFQRLHSAQTQEFSMLSDVILENIPEEGYPYSTKDGDNYIMASDFDERIDIIPVSNPETASKSHRIMKANALTEMSGKFQGLLEPKWVMTQALEAMNIEAPEEAWAQAPQPDPMQQAELEKMQVETQGKSIDNENKQIEAKNTQADTANKNMDTLFSSVQASAQVAANSELIPIAGELNKSAGFIDENAGEITTIPNMQGIVEAPLPDQNTHPQFAPNAEQPMNPSAGINTMENEGV
jgi:hypothetical protein